MFPVKSKEEFTVKILFYLVSGCISIVIALLTLPKLSSFFHSKGLTKINYSGRKVLTGVGLMFLLPCSVGSLPFIFILNEIDYLSYWMIITSLTLAGFFDDLFDTDEVKGFKNHIIALLHGEITTGNIKAIIGFAIGLIISIFNYKGPVFIILNTILFALFINFINILDLRPGRAIKTFLTLSAFFMLSGFSHFWILFPSIVTIPIYIGGEMQEKYMLGDTGANLLGGILGFFALKSLTIESKYLATILLILIHILSEFCSLSRLIEVIPILRYIDMLGSLKPYKGDNANSD